MLAPQKNRQQDLRVHAGFAAPLRTLFEILDALLLVSSQSNHEAAAFHSPRQASDDVVVRAHDQLGLDRRRRKLEHPFMVAARAHCIAQS